MASDPDSDWNPGLYQSGYSFVWERGRDVVGLLSPRRGERILDLGCGTGQLTAEIAAKGALAMGVDKSAAMIAQARANFPQLHFEVVDAAALPFREEFDGVFSNAALHWMPDLAAVTASIERALLPGGRFVAEFGGKGNVRKLMEAGCAALRSLGVQNPERLNPWRFPGIAEFAGILERNGLEVRYAWLFDRPSPLEGGEHALSTWFRMFGRSFTERLTPEALTEFERHVDATSVPDLRPDGIWTADYRRLRVVAYKPAP